MLKGIRLAQLSARVFRNMNVRVPKYLTLYPLAPARHGVGHAYHNYRGNKIND